MKLTTALKSTAELDLSTDHHVWNTVMCAQMEYVRATQSSRHHVGSYVFFRGTRGQRMPPRRVDETATAVLWENVYSS